MPHWSQEILELARHSGIRMVYPSYIYPDDAEKFIRLCTKNDIAIIGIDGIETSEAGNAPFFDVDYDFSNLAWEAFNWSDVVSSMNKECLRITQNLKLPSEIHVNLDFTLYCKNDWIQHLKIIQENIKRGKPKP